MADAETLGFYIREAGSYAARRGSTEHAELAEFASRLPRQARVLDLGCGSGRDSAALLTRGFRVTSVDLSLGLAAEAKRLHGIDVRQLAFEALDYQAAFEGVWASASLHHAPSSALPEIFARIHRALTTNGHFHASFKAGADRRDKLGRFYCAVTEASLSKFVEDRALWQNAEIRVQQGLGHDDEPVQWLILYAQRG